MGARLSAQPEQSYFEQFWDRWPANGSPGFENYTRKKDRKKCQEHWTKHKLDSQAINILHDVEQRRKYDKGWKESKGGFLSAPLVYLNNERWNDGGFADIREAAKAKRPATVHQESEGPHMSRWARGANKILMKLAYQDIRRGFKAMGEDKLKKALEAKRDYVKIAEEADRNGERWPDEDFIDMCREGFGKVLGTE